MNFFWFFLPFLAFPLARSQDNSYDLVDYRNIDCDSDPYCFGCYESNGEWVTEDQGEYCCLETVSSSYYMTTDGLCTPFDDLIFVSQEDITFEHTDQFAESFIYVIKDGSSDPVTTNFKENCFMEEVQVDYDANCLQCNPNYFSVFEMDQEYLLFDSFGQDCTFDCGVFTTPDTALGNDFRICTECPLGCSSCFDLRDSLDGIPVDFYENDDFTITYDSFFWAYMEEE